MLSLCFCSFFFFFFTYLTHFGMKYIALFPRFTRFLWTRENMEAKTDHKSRYFDHFYPEPLSTWERSF